MNIGGVIVCANEWRFVPAVAGQLLKVCSRVVIVRNRLSFSGKPVTLSPVPENITKRVEIIEGEWTTESATRNAGIEHLHADCDYMFVLDSDELFLDDDMKRLVADCETRLYQAFRANLITYWKTPSYRISPPETIFAPVLVRKDVRFKGIRDLDDGVESVGIFEKLQHLSYVRTDEEVRDKIANFSHANEIVPGWYENVWLSWDNHLLMKNLHPTHPACYGQAVLADPTMLQLLDSYGLKYPDVSIGAEKDIATEPWARICSTKKTARIIYDDDGGAMTRDAKIVNVLLAQAGFNDVTTMSYADVESTAPRVALQIIIDHPADDTDFWKGMVPRAERTVLVTDAHLDHPIPFVETWSKNAKWTSFDMMRPMVPREKSFLHVAGKSMHKGTQALIDSWRPEYPLLTVIYCPTPAWDDNPDCAWTKRDELPGNVRLIGGHLGDPYLLEMMNRSICHIYPLDDGSFKHVISEGQSCGAIVCRHPNQMSVDEDETVKRQLQSREDWENNNVEFQEEMKAIFQGMVR